MKRLNAKGYLLIEIILVVLISTMVVGIGSTLLYNGLKECNDSESKLEITYNLREAENYIADEVRGGYEVEILNSTEKGWIKVYKTSDKSSFTTFRLKNNKLFAGFNNTLNPNSEICNSIKGFKVSYIPEGVTDSAKATGVKVLMKFEHNKQQHETNMVLAFRCRK